MPKPLSIAAITAMLSVTTACSGVSTITEQTNRQKVPDWYLSHAAKGSEGIFGYKGEYYYAASEATSPSLQMAEKKAIMLAKASLTDRIKGAMNNRTTLKYDEVGAASSQVGQQQYQDLIVNNISNSILQGYEPTEKYVTYNPEHNNYRAFVLIKMPAEAVNRMIISFDTQKALESVSKITSDIDESAKNLLEN